MLNIQRTLGTTWNYTYPNLDFACNKLSFIKKMCPDLFLEETPSGSILVNDYLPYAATQYLHFSWSLMGGSTVFSRKVLIEDTIFLLSCENTHLSLLLATRDALPGGMTIPH